MTSGPLSIEEEARITARQVPAITPYEILAGWDGNVRGYYVMVRWLDSDVRDRPAGYIELEAGDPMDYIPTVSHLLTWMLAYVDRNSPDFMPVLRELYDDPVVDALTQARIETPYGTREVEEVVLTLIGSEALETRREETLPASAVEQTDALTPSRGLGHLQIVTPAVPDADQLSPQRRSMWRGLGRKG